MIGPYTLNTDYKKRSCVRPFRGINNWFTLIHLYAVAVTFPK